MAKVDVSSDAISAIIRNMLEQKKEIKRGEPVHVEPLIRKTPQPLSLKGDKIEWVGLRFLQGPHHPDQRKLLDPYS